MPILGLVHGSSRASSNTAGVVAHLAALVRRRYPALTLELVDLRSSPGHPLPLEIAGAVPAAHARGDVPAAYPDERVRQWSATVLRWDAVLFVTPQYNWSAPAVLKNALDQLFVEWAGLPAGLVTLGARGGNKAQDELRPVLAGALHMRLAEPRATFVLDKRYIHGGQTVGGDEEWLDKYDNDVVAVVDAVLALVEAKGAAAAAE